jgi:hypothetical protein
MVLAGGLVSIANLFDSKEGDMQPAESTRVHVWESQNCSFPITEQLKVYHLPREQ